MINGKEIDIDTRPYQVAINIDRRYLRIFSECHGGGVIISAKYILTAAHVVNSTDSPEYKYFVRLGTSELTWWGESFDIKENGKICHPLYERLPRLTYDIAILEMDREIQFTNKIQPIVMADENFNTDYLLWKHRAMEEFVLLMIANLAINWKR
ncbi:hypothetical protein HA402_009569 [Bradysia odoriphaga]|nr:hypothetical protein HA402_009569 [Bradysia odoriphaga]